MKTEYNGIEIEYIEGTNDWHFELRGRRRKAESLVQAKAAIDKEPVEKRKQTFPVFDAYMLTFYGAETVTVTSLAENRYSSEPEFWIKKRGDRRKERASHLYPVNAHNTALVEQIKAKDEEKSRIENERGELVRQLQEATVPAEIA